MACGFESHPGHCVGRARKTAGMAYDEDDDWVGEPPEGRYSRDRAKPDFWADKKPVSFVAAGIALVVLVLLLVALLG